MNRKWNILSLAFLAAMALGAAAPDPDAERLTTIAQAISAYTLVHGGKPPARLSDLYCEGYVDSIDVFGSADGKPVGRTELDARCAYAMEPAGATAAGPVVRARTARADGTTLAAFADGAVRPIRTGGGVTSPPIGGIVAPPTVVGPVSPTTRPVDPPGLAEGTELFKAGRYRESLARLDAAVRAAPAHTQAMLMRGGAKLWTNDLNGALADFTAAARLDGAIESRRLQASVELLVGDRNRAWEMARRLASELPDSATMQLLLGQANLWNKDTEAARTNFARCMQLDPVHARKLYAQAGKFLEAGVPLVAHMQYTTILYLDGSSRTAWYGLGIANLRLGYNDRAIQAFEEYLKFDAISEYARSARLELERLRQRR